MSVESPDVAGCRAALLSWLLSARPTRLTHWLDPPGGEVEPWRLLITSETWLSV